VPESTGFIGIIGVLLGALFGYFLSLRAAKLQWRRVAGAKLRAAFAPEIAKYYLNMERGDKWHINMMNDMFKEALPQHAAAIEEYRPFVPRKSQEAYQQAWDNYYRNFLDYYDTGEGEQAVFKQRIGAIFKFSKI
jgi:hypothetical protein